MRLLSVLLFLQKQNKNKIRWSYVNSYFPDLKKAKRDEYLLVDTYIEPVLEN